MFILPLLVGHEIVLETEQLAIPVKVLAISTG